VVGFGPCDEFGFAEAVLEVSTQNATGDVLRATVNEGIYILESSQTTVTTNPMAIRIAVRGDGVAEDVVVSIGANTNVELVAVTAPVCPEQCTISEFSLVSVSPFSTDGYQSSLVVTKVVADAPSNRQISVSGGGSYGNSFDLENGTIFFTNTVFFTGGPMILTAQSILHPSLTGYPVCAEAELTINPSDFCTTNDCIAIPDVDFTFGPCDGFGYMTATVEFSHTNVPADSLFTITIFDGDSVSQSSAVPFFQPVTGSPMSYSFVVAGNRSGMPFAAAQQRAELTIYRLPNSFLGPAARFTSLPAPIFITDVDVAIPDCLPADPLPPCEFELEIELSECQPAGYAEVKVSIVSSNTVPLNRYFQPPYLLGTSPNQGAELILTDSRSYRLEAGTWVFNVGAGGCTASREVVVPDCPNLCEIHSIDVAVSDCLPDGKAELTIELSATNAIDTLFNVELRQGGRQVFFDRRLYTNTPSVFRLLVDAAGAPVDLSVSQRIPLDPVQTGFGDVEPQYSIVRQGCKTQAVDIVMPNCFELPSICLTVPPRIIDIDPGDDPVLSYLAPTNTICVIERCYDDLTNTWGVLAEDAATIAAPRSYTDYFPDLSRDYIFYRIRCKPVPIAVPAP